MKKVFGLIIAAENAERIFFDQKGLYEKISKTFNDARFQDMLTSLYSDFKEENKIMGGFGGDPLMKLKSRELDLRAQENQRKEESDEDRMGLDTMKVMVGDQQHDEKLEQNEELAELRAGVSLTKQRMADKSKRHDFGRNFKKK